MKRGLVLEGGGAKGAYALGCLLAFRDRGVTFDVISGTSVGSLNAAISSAGRIDLGKDLWQNLSFDKVCDSSKRFTTWLLIPFHFFALFLHHVPFIGSPPFPNRLEPTTGYALIIVNIGGPIALSWVIFFAGVWFVDDYRELLTTVLIGNAIMITLGLLWVIPFFMRQKNIAMFTTSPLKSEIQRVLQDAKFNIPTYITLCYRREMFDPDKPGFLEHVSQGIHTRDAMSQEEYIPHYVRIDKLPMDRVFDMLTASAALPFGIFPSVTLEGTEYIDGGVVDNIPSYPILKNYRCDEVYVVRLRPHHSGDIEKSWKRVDRRLRVAAMDESKCKSMYHGSMKRRRKVGLVDVAIDPPENVRFNKFPISKENLLIFAPKKSLGSFWSGTMNFRKSYTNRLVQMGFEDTIKILDRKT